VASRLKAVAPKAAEPSKPKVLIFGKPGVGKTWASLEWPSVFYVDTEGGADLAHYTDKLARAGGVYFGPDQGSLSFDGITEQVQALATERHDFRTLVLDSISHVWNMEIAQEQARLGDKDAYGASKKPAVAKLRQLLMWVNKLDMNVILIAHEKDLWGKDGKEGVTFDCDPKLEYLLHLCLNIQKIGPKRLARIGKSRLPAFPEGEVFDWNFTTFAERYGRDVIEKEAKPIVLASAEQIAEVKRLLETVKLPDGTVEKWMAAADAASWEEFETDKINKCISALRAKIAA